MNTETRIKDRITFDEAKKSLASMNLIDGFLFDSAIEDKDDARVVMGNILKAIFNRKFIISDVTSQKSYQAIDSAYHGIRFDAYIEEDLESDNLIATVYDVEMENREADRKYLPKRFRYYSALHDVKKLGSGDGYDKLPNFVSVTILSYDPFLAGDMYYEASTTLITHPDIEYDDGVRHIYLYCNGRPNFKVADSDLDSDFCKDSPSGIISISPEHSQKLQEMLKYIVSGQKPSAPNTDIDAIEDIVAKIKNRKEVIDEYMRQWDRELSIKREVREETTREVKEEDALEMIRFCKEEGISDDKIRNRLNIKFELSPQTINDLFAKIEAENTVTTK